MAPCPFRVRPGRGPPARDTNTAKIYPRSTRPQVRGKGGMRWAVGCWVDLGPPPTAAAHAVPRGLLRRSQRGTGRPVAHSGRPGCAASVPRLGWVLVCRGPHPPLPRTRPALYCWILVVFSGPHSPCRRLGVGGSRWRVLAWSAFAPAGDRGRRHARIFREQTGATGPWSRWWGLGPFRVRPGRGPRARDAHTGPWQKRRTAACLDPQKSRDRRLQVVALKCAYGRRAIREGRCKSQDRFPRVRG